MIEENEGWSRFYDEWDQNSQMEDMDKFDYDWYWEEVLGMFESPSSQKTGGGMSY